MHEDLKGRTLVDQPVTASAATIDAVAGAIGTASAAATATLVPFFAATAAGGSSVVDGLGLDLSRALLAGLSYEWYRPFGADEPLRLRITVDDVYAKGTNTFVIVGADFTDAHGATVQRQVITFVERGGAS